MNEARGTVTTCFGWWIYDSFGAGFWELREKFQKLVSTQIWELREKFQKLVYTESEKGVWWILGEAVGWTWRWSSVKLGSRQVLALKRGSFALSGSQSRGLWLSAKTSHDGVLNLAGSLHWMYSGPFCGVPWDSGRCTSQPQPRLAWFFEQGKVLSPNWSYFLSREKFRATFSACTIGQG